jgi:hypothetical protein
MSAPLDFLRLFAGRLRGAGIRFAITSGMACVHYGLQQTTKDSDWIIAPADLGKFRALLLELEGERRPWRVSYRPIFGAPLDAQFMAHGWTSHLLVTEADGTVQKVDLFGKAPRVQTVETDPGQPDYASRHVVALMKRTDRDRDWPIVFGCGVQMLECNDSRGVLHLQEAEWLRRAWASVPPESRLEFQRLRPVLRLVETQPSRLRRLIIVERALWEAVNRTRYRPFERCWKDFYRVWSHAPGVVWPVEAAFATQHQLLVEAAARYNLPHNPLAGVSREQLLRDAQTDAAEALAASPEELAQITPPLEVLYP